jgi:hypothetical protein
MASPKPNNAKFLLGIRDVNSGTLNFLKFSKNGRVELSEKEVHVKRPNQYTNKRK